MITASINVSRIDKGKLIKGEKGVYCNLILIETPNSEYGDYMIKQDQGKGERDSGNKTPILGNARIRGKGKKAAPQPNVDDNDEIPF